MKKAHLCLIVCLATLRATAQGLVPQAAEEPPPKGCLESIEAGRSAAKEDYHPILLFFVGATANLTGAVIGWSAMTPGVGLAATGGMALVARTLTPSVPIPASFRGDTECYRDGYLARARNKNTTAAIAGGLISGFVFLLIASGSSSN